MTASKKFTPEEFMEAIGIDGKFDSVRNLIVSKDSDELCLEVRYHPKTRCSICGKEMYGTFEICSGRCFDLGK